MTTELSTEQKKERIDAITKELETLNVKIIELETEKKDLMKSVKSAIRKELNATAKLYGLSVVNSKSKKQSNIDTETE